MTNPVGVAMIGTGRWAGRLARAVQRSAAIEVVTCFSRDPGKRSAFAESYGCRVATTLEEAIEDRQVEALLLVTPNGVHAEQARMGAAAGKHVFTEKPIADTLEDGLAMRDACRQAGVTLYVGHSFRRLGASRKTKEVIDSGALGRIVLVEANFSLKSSRLTPEAWRYYREKCPGGPLIQLGVHHADTLQYWLGPLSKVKGTFTRPIAQAEIDDVGMALLDFESGAIGILSSSYVSPRTYTFRLHGTEGILDYVTDMSGWPNAEALDGLTQLTVGDGAGSKPLPFESRDMLVEELEDFARCVRGQAQPETGADEGLAALQVVLGAIHSHENGGTYQVIEV